MPHPIDVRQRYLSVVSCRCTVEGRPSSWEQLRVRCMNFGQHWRTPDVVVVRYSVDLPERYFADFLERELPAWVRDCQQHPSESELELETALREHDWPTPAQLLLDPTLATLTLAYFADELLGEWLGDGSLEPGVGHVINTVDHVEIVGGLPRIEGTARRNDRPVRYQDA